MTSFSFKKFFHFISRGNFLLKINNASQLLYAVGRFRSKCDILTALKWKQLKNLSLESFSCVHHKSLHLFCLSRFKNHIFYFLWLLVYFVWIVHSHHACIKWDVVTLILSYTRAKFSMKQKAHFDTINRETKINLLSEEFCLRWREK